MMKITSRIAIKYFFTYRSYHFITFITIISIIGIVIGVAALICVLSIFNGFGEFTEKQLIGLDPHIRILSKQGVWISDYELMLKDLKKDSRISASSPVIQGRIIGIKSGNMKVIQLFGYLPDEILSVSGIPNSGVVGEFDISDNGDIPKISLGAGLAQSLKCIPGENISVMSLNMIESGIKSFSKPQGIELNVSGIFQTNNIEYDIAYGYTSLKTAAMILNVPANSVSGIDIKVKKINDAEKIKSELNSKFPKFNISSWFDLHSDLYNIMKLERMAVFVVLSLIIIIAVFNVLASLSMTVVEKKQDIAIFKSLGANNRMISRIYLNLGLMIGISGTVIGAILGLVLSLSQQYYGWIKLKGAQYLVDALPVSVNLWDVVLVVVVALSLSYVSTIYPSRRASKSSIIEALRSE